MYYQIIKGFDNSNKEIKYKFDIYDSNNFNDLPLNKSGIFIIAEKTNNKPNLLSIQYTSRLSEYFPKKEDLLIKLKKIGGNRLLFYKCDKEQYELDDIVVYINKYNGIY